MVVPPDTPVTMPEAAPMDPIVGEVLVHKPPVAVLPKVDVKPVHTVVVPVIADGTGFIETLMVLEEHASIAE